MYTECASTVEQESDYWDSRVGELKGRIDQCYFELGIALSRIQDDGYYARFGYKDIIEYARDRYDISPRKTLGLIAIAQKFLPLPEFRAGDMEGVSWTKALKLLPVVNDDNYREWLDRAKTLSGDELANVVLLSRGKTSRMARRIAFTVYIDEYETIEDALQLAAKLTGSERRGAQFVALAQEFLSSYCHCSSSVER